jgi:hypothetical protein
MKGIGRMMREMARALKCIKIRTLIKVSFSTVRLMELESINGRMENHMMASGLKDSKKEMEFGKDLREIHM